MHVGVACQRPDLTVAVSSSIFVSLEFASRLLLAEGAEVVEGKAVLDVMPYHRPRVQLLR